MMNLYTFQRPYPNQRNGGMSWGFSLEGSNILTIGKGCRSQDIQVQDPSMIRLLEEGCPTLYQADIAEATKGYVFIPLEEEVYLLYFKLDTKYVYHTSAGRTYPHFNDGRLLVGVYGEGLIVHNGLQFISRLKAGQSTFLVDSCGEVTKITIPLTQSPCSGSSENPVVARANQSEVTDLMKNFPECCR